MPEVEKKIMDPLVIIEMKYKGTQAEVVITDNAGGIPPGVIEKIFDPYFTTRDNGTGMGLYLV